MTDTKKICLDCQHWDMDYESDWSEITMGIGFTTSCRKGHWHFQNGEISAAAFRSAVATAQTCGDYLEIDP